jgi:hypothetical protein
VLERTGSEHALYIKLCVCVSFGKWNGRMIYGGKFKVFKAKFKFQIPFGFQICKMKACGKF